MAEISRGADYFHGTLITHIRQVPYFCPESVQCTLSCHSLSHSLSLLSLCDTLEADKLKNDKQSTNIIEHWKQNVICRGRPPANKAGQIMTPFIKKSYNNLREQIRGRRGKTPYFPTGTEARRRRPNQGGALTTIARVRNASANRTPVGMSNTNMALFVSK